MWGRGKSPTSGHQRVAAVAPAPGPGPALAPAAAPAATPAPAPAFEAANQGSQSNVLSADGGGGWSGI